MQNKILAILLSFALVSVSGCGAKVESTGDNTTSMFVVIEKTSAWEVVYHKDTKVMYAVSFAGYNYGNFTLLVNSDGTPMIYEGDLDEEK